MTDSIARFQREAAQRERLSSLGRLSTVVAHEIRNPLMIIKAALRGLQARRRRPGRAARRGHRHRRGGRPAEPHRHRGARLRAPDRLRAGAGRPQCDLPRRGPRRRRRRRGAAAGPADARPGPGTGRHRRRAAAAGARQRPDQRPRTRSWHSRPAALRRRRRSGWPLRRDARRALRHRRRRRRHRHRRRTTCRGSSIRSSPPAAPAPVSAWRSRGTSSRGSAARSASPARRAAAPRSASSCRLSRGARHARGAAAAGHPRRSVRTDDDRIDSARRRRGEDSRGAGRGRCATRGTRSSPPAARARRSGCSASGCSTCWSSTT